MYNVTLRRVRETIVAVEKKEVLHVCVFLHAARGCPGACMCVRVALLSLHATRMRHIVSFVASLAPPHFSTLSHKRHDFRKNVTEYKICAFIFSTTFG